MPERIMFPMEVGENQFRLRDDLFDLSLRNLVPADWTASIAPRRELLHQRVAHRNDPPLIHLRDLRRQVDQFLLPAHTGPIHPQDLESPNARERADENPRQPNFSSVVEDELQFLRRKYRHRLSRDFHLDHILSLSRAIFWQVTLRTRKTKKRHNLIAQIIPTAWTDLASIQKFFDVRRLNLLNLVWDRGSKGFQIIFQNDRRIDLRVAPDV